MAREALASIRSVSKAYVTASGQIEALHGVDADFYAGEITAVIGASGSGKSTLLKAVAGLDRPTSGDLFVAGTNLTRASPRTLRRHRQRVVTYVNQRAVDNFVPHLRMREQDDDGRALELLRDFGLAARVDSRPVELSGGEQARAAFALALARGTPLLIADEPTAELDRTSARPLLEAVGAHAGSGTAFVIATHDEEVIAIADRVVRLDRGQVVAAGTLRRPAGRARHATVPGTPALTARDLRKEYRVGPETVHAVRDATLDVRRGELGALLGRSGSGKSTLLTLLAGISRPSAGAVHFEPDARAPAELTWGELAFLPQRFGLLPELPVRENVELPIRLARGRTGHRSVDDLLERLGLVDLAGRAPEEISIGQQQRTALARALVLHPTVLLADEPTSHQDAAWRDRVCELLVEAAGAGTACLVATNDEEVIRYAGRVLRMDSGVVTGLDD